MPSDYPKEDIRDIEYKDSKTSKLNGVCGPFMLSNEKFMLMFIDLVHDNVGKHTGVYTTIDSFRCIKIQQNKNERYIDEGHPGSEKV